MVRWITGHRLLKYPEEEADFECPKCYRNPESIASSSSEKDNTGFDPSALPVENEKEGVQSLSITSHDGQADGPNAEIHAKMGLEGGLIQPTFTRTRTRERTPGYTRERFDIEKEEATLRERNIPIIAQRNDEGDILVDWYTTDDPANPQNWSSMKKAFVGLLIL